ncbi:hypothetical protein N7495_000936 [Penicillium taxi]|uniref:uncharacterized protein n=1 Tax=Penicillium taxi TaxID=168475 RepID=UPI002544F4B2|nr:uncharacterized protein N7495_000936 [Penicillium taxi]KAJ5908254.1 hypothetical protein N7495_000936 [Penicillium taxi]
MLSLSAVVAIAASGAAIFVVLSVVGIVIWVRFRKERHALKMLRLNHGRHRSIQTFTGDTLTELTRAEGSVLRAHGQLPYGKPTEWGQLASRETLLEPKDEPNSSFPFVRKARSMRRSISRSASQKFSRLSHHRISSMTTTSETAIRILASPPGVSESKEDIPLSAIEGCLELPAERTPRQSPEINQEEAGFVLGMRPVSPSWPLQKDQSSMFSVSEIRSSRGDFETPTKRVRGGSIASQLASIPPDQPVPPPPPFGYPLDRLSYMRNDSVMRLSSMSLDTTNSSILDGPASKNDFTPSVFGAGGTFVPYSANDVGVKNGRRSFIATNTSLPPLHNFPTRSSSTVEGRRLPSNMDLMTAPRRCMTTTSRNISNASDRFGYPLHHSDSMSSNNVPSRQVSQRSRNSLSLSDWTSPSNINWRHSDSSQISYVPPFTRFEENDPFYGNSTAKLFTIGSPGQSQSRRSSGTSKPPSPMQRSSASLGGVLLPSALKGPKSKRKGHRRQNCVRISIHPPMTFGGSFYPTVEEEPEDFEEMEEWDLRESAMNDLTKPQVAITANPSPSPLSKRSSRRNKPAAAAPSTLGPVAEEPQSMNKRKSSKRRKCSPSESVDHDSPINNYLPELVTSLTRTPSPKGRSPANDNSLEWGSPRRSLVKGPRSRLETANLSTSNGPAQSPTKSPLDDLPIITGTQGSDWRKSTHLNYRTTDSADRSHRHSNSQSSISSIIVSSNPQSSGNGARRSNSTVRDRVTIWEDANRSASPPKLAAPAMGNYSFSKQQPSSQAVPRSLSNNERPPSRMSSRVQPAPDSASTRFDQITPNRKTHGLGIGITATPGSLYDGDGFLRE